MNSDRSSRSASQPGADELPVIQKVRHGEPVKKTFVQRNVLPWLILGLVALVGLVVAAFLLPKESDIIIHVSTALALFFLLFAFGLIANLGKRSAVVAVVVIGMVYALTAWTPLVGVKTVLVLAMLVAFVLFALAGFNFLFVVEEVLFDIHRLLNLRGLLWDAIPTMVIVGVTPLVYWILPLAGLRWPTLQVAMPVVLLLLIVAWVMRWRAGPTGMRMVREAVFLSIGTIAGAGLADIVAMLNQVEGIIPSVVAYLTILVTWVFVSYNTLQRAQYFLRGTDVFPWMAILLASGFAVLAHVQFLYGAAGAPGLAAVSEVRVTYLVFGVWLGLLFFFVRGAWRFFRFVRDEKQLGAGTRRTAGRVARVMETMMESSGKVREGGARIFSSIDRVVPGSERKHEPKRKRDHSRFREDRKRR